MAFVEQEVKRVVNQALEQACRLHSKVIQIGQIGKFDEAWVAVTTTAEKKGAEIMIRFDTRLDLPDVPNRSVPE